MSFHPDLNRARRMPRGVPVTPLGHRLMQGLTRIASRRAPVGGSVADASGATVRVFTPDESTGAAVLMTDRIEWSRREHAYVFAHRDVFDRALA
jgi:hypothetical protein